VVVDIFSGSNTTGYVAEALGRRWISIELNRSYAWLSAVRFMEEWDFETITATIERLKNGESLDLSEVELIGSHQLELPAL
jgi:site-specific DNA-methyltransferase (cytosine-N4-specific)